MLHMKIYNFLINTRLLKTAFKKKTNKSTNGNMHINGKRANDA